MLGRGLGVQDCRLQFLLKTQFEAKSRYEHAHDRKLVEQVMESWPLGKVKGRTEAVRSLLACLLAGVIGVSI